MFHFWRVRCGTWASSQMLPCVRAGRCLTRYSMSSITFSPSPHYIATQARAEKFVLRPWILYAKNSIALTSNNWQMIAGKRWKRQAKCLSIYNTDNSNNLRVVCLHVDAKFAKSHFDTQRVLLWMMLMVDDGVENDANDMMSSWIYEAHSERKSVKGRST